MDYIKQLIIAAIQSQIDELLKAKATLETAIADLEDLKKKFSDSPEAARILFKTEITER